VLGICLVRDEYGVVKGVWVDCMNLAFDWRQFERSKLGFVMAIRYPEPYTSSWSVYNEKA
jgi:hypothetical protein